MSQYDVYLNVKGYMLAKDSRGALIPGACREQIVDPFTSQLARDEPYTRAAFRFGDGAGLHEYDGSHRYEWGNCVDARSGHLMMAPERVVKGAPYYEMKIHDSSVLVAEQLDSGGSQYGLAERFQMPASGYTTIRSIAILVKRSDSMDYTNASTFTVGIVADAAGPKPGTTLGSATVALKAETDAYSPFPDRWRHGDWFWLEATFSSDVVVGAGNYYWISVYNNQSPEVLHWAEDQYGGTIATRSVHNGTAWQDGTSDYRLMIKVSYRDGAKQFDSFLRCMQVYRGSDNIERMYAGTNYRVLYYNPAWGGGQWWESKETSVPVLQLLEFDNKLFAALGPATDMEYSDGSSPESTAWTTISSNQANALAVHDNMIWKADDNEVKASTTGMSADWGATAVKVGDPGTPVQAMVSHGGKLFCAKPEGIYEVTYPDTYPGSGTPTANLMLDFNTERYPRTWLIDWHSGLYFPGAGGVYELKSGLLRNLWEDKVDEGALDPRSFMAPPMVAPVKGTDPPYTRPRSWAPLYDHGPVSWTCAQATTRGILFARSNPHQHTSDLIWYDGRNWYSLRSVGDLASDGGPRNVGEYLTACFVQDAGGGRGWMWFNEGFGIAQTEWPTWTDNTADDDTVEYEDRAQAVTPWFSLAENREILLVKVGLTSYGLAPPISFQRAEVHYRLAGQSSWTELGDFETSPYQEISFPAGTKSHRIQFKLEFDCYQQTVTISPMIEQLDLFYQTIPEKSTTHQLILSCAGNADMRTGGTDERTAGETLADLRALLGISSFTYKDPEGVSHTVRVTALTGQLMNFHTGPGPEGAGTEYQVILNLLEV